MNKKIVNDVPDNEVDQLVRDFQDDGCNVVSKHKQDNGLWRVEALCPEVREDG